MRKKVLLRPGLANKFFHSNKTSPNLSYHPSKTLVVTYQNKNYYQHEKTIKPALLDQNIWIMINNKLSSAQISLRSGK